MKNQKRNQLVVWDRIIETEEDAKFSVQNVDPKYPLIDDGTGLRYVATRHTSIPRWSCVAPSCAGVCLGRACVRA